MYEIHFRRDYSTYNDFAFIGRTSTLEEAKSARKVSGDLVTKNGIVVNSQEWLFDWEKTDPDCYAQKAISWDQKRL